MKGLSWELSWYTVHLAWRRSFNLAFVRLSCWLYKKLLLLLGFSNSRNMHFFETGQKLLVLHQTSSVYRHFSEIQTYFQWMTERCNKSNSWNLIFKWLSISSITILWLTVYSYSIWKFESKFRFRYWFRPLGVHMGLRNKRNRNAPANEALERKFQEMQFKKNFQQSHSELKELGAKLQLTERQVREDSNIRAKLGLQAISMISCSWWAFFGRPLFAAVIGIFSRIILILSASKSLDLAEETVGPPLAEPVEPEVENAASKALALKLVQLVHGSLHNVLDHGVVLFLMLSHHWADHS